MFYGYKIKDHTAFHKFVDQFIEEYKKVDKTAIEYKDFTRKHEIERRLMCYNESKHKVEDIKKESTKESEGRSTRFIFTQNFVTPLFVATEYKSFNDKITKMVRTNNCPYDALSIDFLRAAFNYIDYMLECNPLTENYFIMGNFATIIVEVRQA